MRIVPAIVKVSLFFQFLTALIWVVFGIIVVLSLHPALPEEPLLRWGMGIIAIAGGLILAGLGILLMRKSRMAYWLSLAGLGTAALVNLFDEVGWLDAAVVLISLLPFILLLISIRWFLKP